MSRRHDIQDATGRIEYLAGRGTLQAWFTSAPTNGQTGFAPGCTGQDIANGHVYVNLGTFSSSLWVVDDGSALSQLVFGSGTATMLGSGNMYRKVSGVGLNPGSTAADIVVDTFTLPASSLDGTSNRGLLITASGNKASNTNAVTAKIIFNATTAVVGSAVTGGTTVATTGASTTTGGVGWQLAAQIFKYGALNSNTQIYQEISTVVGTTHGGMGTAAAITATENAAILIAITINAATTVTDGSLWWWEVTGYN